MPYLIGTDEAGYGPNLGPLVISASIWWLPDHLFQSDLYEVLQEFIAPSPSGNDDRIVMADSKLLYKSGGGLAGLERGVLPAVAVTSSERISGEFSSFDNLQFQWRDVWQALDPDCTQYLDTLPWLNGYDASVPSDLEILQMRKLSAFLQQGLNDIGIQLCALRSKVVFPQQLNEGIDTHGTKGAALSKATLSLIQQSLAPLDEEPVQIVCDKHGGRNKYGPLLQETFPDYLIEICRESRPESMYRWGSANRRVEIRFVTKGERYLSAALASMTSKYLRELAMQAFNRFWQQHVPDLQRTAGYPTDARRFKADIAQVQSQLGIDDHILWRNR